MYASTAAPAASVTLSDTFMSLRDVTAATRLGRSTIYARIAQGLFPVPAKAGRSSLFSRREVEEWIAARLAERPAPKAIAA